ncbi:radical SAM protein [Bacillus manliponensis]|uniref:radical SAM protein n=1 Tax=Bacillus manliponensis TaxID=574376 RepID=UPI000558941A|nr:radical SAM protein [Bacillus manliponensis]
MKNVYPNVITIITTYKCTAACAECCFECSPKLTARVTLEQMKNFIRESKELFKEELKGVVFTGGECFLLGDDLVEAISYATKLGLTSRCVTNGYWGKNPKLARKTLKLLKEAGLKEINISTGDDHQEFVPFDSVINGVIEACELGISSLIVVEGHESSKFKYMDVINNQKFINFQKNSSNADLLNVMNNVWIPFNKDREIIQNESLKQTPNKVLNFRGCDNIFQNFVLTPYNKVASCCGLTMEHIPEMKIGEYVEGSLEEYFNNQYNDFLKIWIWVEGPEKIYYFASQMNDKVQYNSNITHNCQACVEIYQNELIKETLLNHWEKVYDDVMFKYELKRKHFQTESSFVSY